MLAFNLEFVALSFDFKLGVPTDAINLLSDYAITYQ